MMRDGTIDQLILNQMPISTKLLTSYVSLGLDETDVMILLHIQHFLQQSIDFPTPAQIANYVSISERECTEKLRYLIQKRFLEIKGFRDEQGKWSEAYSLEPLWERLLLKDEVKPKEIGHLFVKFEKEFGRPLSPFEIETINIWLDEDQIHTELIIAALREAVLMGKLNFKYMDRMLREWKRKGIQSVEQAKQQSENFHQQREQKQYKREKEDTSIYYNWLDGGSSF